MCIHSSISLTLPYFSFQDFFHEGEYIIREGATGDTFFIINKGEVSTHTVKTVNSGKGEVSIHMVN